MTGPHQPNARAHGQPDVRVLTADLDTRIGRYPTGTVVLIISQGTQHTSICLDSGGWHPNRRCHTYTLPHHMITTGGGDP